MRDCLILSTCKSSDDTLALGCYYSFQPKDDRGKLRDHIKTGDRRLIFRALPLQRTSKDAKKRGDCHLWPKGKSDSQIINAGTGNTSDIYLSLVYFIDNRNFHSA